MALVLLAAVGCISAGGDDVDTNDSASDCSPGACGGRPDPNGPARTVHIVWTIGGEAASAATCANSPQYAAELQTDPTRYRATDMVLYPVPCAEGKLTIANVPARYWVGGLQTSLTGERAGAAGPFDQATQTVTIDMMPW
jgi:hypothetical protein